MQTVGDFMKARCSLRVTCSNCDHHVFFNTRFLQERLGYYARVADANFECQKCKGRNVRLAPAREDLAQPKMAKFQHFSGVYENLQ